MRALLAPTIPRLYTALAQWLACLIPVLLFRAQRRFHGFRLAGVLLAGLSALEAEMVLSESAPVEFWLISMMGAVAIMFLLLWSCCELDAVSIGCCTAWSFLLSEFAASLTWQLHYYAISIYSGGSRALRELLMVLLVYPIVFFLDYLLNKGSVINGRANQEDMRTLITVAVICVFVFTVSNLSFIVTSSPFTSTVTSEIYNIRTLVDLGGLAFVYAYYLQQRELKARFEIESMQGILDAQYAQFRLNQDGIDLINRKYHDMKHQIAALRSEADPERRNQWLNRLEQDISVYDTQCKSGNNVLDTMLSSKKLYCQQHRITLTSVADGSLLDFMEPMDICALFGNALDNAIEAAMQVDDPEKRLIHLSVSAQKSFLLIRVENYFEGVLDLDEGLPRTTKGDSAFHGFGVRSIQYTARRYGGSISITSENHWFDLKILIPLL